MSDQHMMVDEELLDKIAKISDIRSGDRVLEIGGGTGNLTKRLAKKRCALFVVEKDSKFARLLDKEFDGIGDIRIIEGDILKVELPRFNKIVANMPYSIVEQFFERLVRERRYDFDEAIMVIPYGLAAKITAKPDSKNFGRASALFLAFYSVEILFAIGRNSFMPKPKVGSAAIRITPQRAKSQKERRTRRILRELFLQDGKKVKSAIAQLFWDNGNELLGRKMNRKESRSFVGSFLAGYGDKTASQLDDEDFRRLAIAVESL